MLERLEGLIQGHERFDRPSYLLDEGKLYGTIKGIQTTLLIRLSRQVHWTLARSIGDLVDTALSNWRDEHMLEPLSDLKRGGFTWPAGFDYYFVDPQAGHTLLNLVERRMYPLLSDLGSNRLVTPLIRYLNETTPNRLPR